MKRIEVYAVGILLALVPAVFGLWGNASFSKDVPVRVPDQARATTVVVTHNTRALVAADRAGRTPAACSGSAASLHTIRRARHQAAPQSRRSARSARR